MIVYLFLILVLLYPVVFQRKYSFVDIYLIICLYFDASISLAGNQKINISYTQAAVFLLFAVNYILTKMAAMNKIEKEMFYLTGLFTLVSLIFPLLKGQSLNTTVRFVVTTTVPMFILPIAFHHYSTDGDIEKLFRVSGLFMILWVILVIVFTLFKVDAIRGSNLGSGGFGMGVIYFGEMAGRGAISYIALLFVMLPLILPTLKSAMRINLIISSGLIAAIMLVALKRFSLIALVLGFLNYFINTRIRFAEKVLYAFVGLIVLTPLFMFTNLTTLTTEQFNRRRGAEKYSIEAIGGDLRIVEPLHVIPYTLQGGLIPSLIGRQTDDMLPFDIEYKGFLIVGRVIHNQYAQYILIYGFIGVLLYLAIFFRTYWITRKLKNRIKSKPGYNTKYWLVFQNVVLIFLAGGIAGGHSHVTYRSLVLLLAGAICGHFYKLNRREAANKLLRNET